MKTMFLAATLAATSLSADVIEAPATYTIRPSGTT